jgi:hypothetical protein
MASLTSARSNLKTKLIRHIQFLDPLDALLPSQHPDIDQMIHDLEDLTPIQQPLSATHLPILLGNWQLVYASEGTVVTRQVSDSGKFMPVRIQRVWQRLNRTSNATAPIESENGAVLSIPFLGEITAVAKGIWQPYEEAESANVSFGAVSLQPTRLLGMAGFNLPKITIPVLDFLRREALWITSYLDEDLRFGRGATGNLFVFKRETPQ